MLSAPSRLDQAAAAPASELPTWVVANGSEGSNAQLAALKEWQALHNGDVIAIGPFSAGREGRCDVGCATQLISRGTCIHFPPLRRLSLASAHAGRQAVKDFNSAARQAYTIGRNAENDTGHQRPSVSRFTLGWRSAARLLPSSDCEPNGLMQAGQKVSDKVLAAGDTLAIGQRSARGSGRHAPDTESMAAPIDVSSRALVLAMRAGDGAIDTRRCRSARAL